MISAFFKAIGKFVRGISKFIIMLAKLVGALIILTVDHIILGMIGGAATGLVKGGSGLFGMGMRSFALSLASKTVNMK